MPHAADLCGLERVELIDRRGFFAAGELVKLAISVLHGDISDLLRIERENLLFGVGKVIVHFRGLNLRQNKQNHGVCEDHRRNDDENSPQLPAFHVGSTSLYCCNLFYKKETIVNAFRPPIFAWL